MSYDSYDDWYDNGPGSVSFGDELRREMRRLQEKVLDGDMDYMDYIRREVKNRYQNTKESYENEWKAWPLDSTDDKEIEPLEDELFDL